MVLALMGKVRDLTLDELDLLRLEDEKVEGLRVGTQAVYELTDGTGRANMKTRFQRGQLTHSVWRLKDYGCTCLVGSVTSPRAKSDVSLERVIDLRFPGIPREPYEKDDFGFTDHTRERERADDLRRIHNASHAYEAFISALADASVRRRPELDLREHYEVAYLLARHVVLQELDRLSGVDLALSAV